MSRCMQITFYLSNNIFDLIYLSVCSFVHVFVYLSNIFMYFSIRSSIYPFIYLSPYLFNSVYVLAYLSICMKLYIHMSQDLSFYQVSGNDRLRVMP